MEKIMRGKKAKSLCHAIQKSFDDALENQISLCRKGFKASLNHFKYSPAGSGIFKDGSVWVAFDNSTGDFWIEEFKSKFKAKKWLRRES